MPLATVALYTLAMGASCVGMCLGVLLPLIVPGACAGGVLSILVGMLAPKITTLYFGLICPFMVLVGALLSYK